MAKGLPNRRTRRAARRRGSGRALRLGAFSLFSAGLVLFVGVPGPVRDAAAQTLGDRISGAASGQKGPMVVEANEVVYDDKAHSVTAEGDAQIYYEGKVLEADRVTYFKDTGRVLAEGSVKLTDPDGSVTHADKMELSGDFKQGFVDTVRADTKERTHVSATRSDKVDADTTVFYRGTYTACPSCAEHPERPPLWRLRAKKIIHKNNEQMLYFEDATFELYGYPIAYFPFFSTADPSVKRQSGFLAPRIAYRSTTGYGLGTPYFWAIAPNMDLTVTPMYLMRQGLWGDVEFRHRLDNGYYYIDINGIHQQADSAFAPQPWGSGDQTNRGAVTTQGTIWLSQKWKFGWDVMRVSDKWYVNDYGLPNPVLNGNFYSETSSSVYLNGQGDRGYFDLRGYSFQGLSNFDYQPQLAAVWPMWDYNKTIDLAPEKTHGIGGQLEIDANLTSSSAALASYQQVGAIEIDNLYGLHPVCNNPVTGKPDYTPGACILRGIGGNYTSGTVELSWKRKIIDPLGEVFTPFAFLRANGNYLNYSTSGSATFGSDTIANAYQSNYFGDNNQFQGTMTPGVGLEWRYPLLARTPIGSLVIEPIAQIIARPNSQISNTIVNLDAQSLVFDDSNLFEWDKYSGYDRFETGVRANYGAQFTLDMDKHGYVNAMFGQSAQVAGVNSYNTPDAANVGLESGLNTPMSDYITRVTYTPNSNYSFIAKARFNEATWALAHLDVTARAHYGPIEFSGQFADYEQQPMIGYIYRREGLQFSSKYNVLEHYFVSGNINFDLSRHYYYPDYLPTPQPTFSIAAWGIGAGYTDDCTNFSINYTNAISDNFGNPPAYVRNQTLLLTLDLRTLGDIKAPIMVSPGQIQDGVRYN
ncbi:LPS assembly protein LptD [Rhodoblastus acidophilus]|uniref:LPS-assembly protein LptD n=1 Tax=Candidatus Rhodoblastus alkanivorans TaxID=2954117 RepID=A0ABS9Z713_9HYPH|nr:LPS assembly protein LptD [Candidatus Rhodoblastus alkanivorans]MCI4678745.1 LPS assembly protein LptD [Candidatus Rhodoblastus alkanivorans]MCI4683459.1 LPS assembly protein LptD [Candidatus Rhodoblastus alkanivorans]MDI4640773.1 LPS assembly protein LptD [Rhodoblastus acidophilus]